MEKRKIYISGAMSSLSREEYLLEFSMAEYEMREFGYDVVNPARRMPLWLYRLIGYRLTLAYDLWLLRRCTHIRMLRGWHKSRGARLEYRTARRLGLIIVDDDINRL